MRLIYKVGLTAVVGAFGLIAHLYNTDSNVKSKTDAAVDSIKDLLAVIARKKSEAAENTQKDILENQEAVLQQWESLDY